MPPFASDTAFHGIGSDAGMGSTVRRGACFVYGVGAGEVSSCDGLLMCSARRIMSHNSDSFQELSLNSDSALVVQRQRDRQGAKRCPPLQRAGP